MQSDGLQSAAKGGIGRNPGATTCSAPTTQGADAVPSEILGVNIRHAFGRDLVHRQRLTPRCLATSPDRSSDTPKLGHIA